jgi:hypothetical protein
VVELEEPGPEHGVHLREYLPEVGGHLAERTDDDPVAIGAARQKRRYPRNACRTRGTPRSRIPTPHPGSHAIADALARQRSPERGAEVMGDPDRLVLGHAERVTARLFAERESLDDVDVQSKGSP